MNDTRNVHYLSYNSVELSKDVKLFFLNGNRDCDSLLTTLLHKLVRVNSLRLQFDQL